MCSPVKLSCTRAIRNTRIVFSSSSPRSMMSDNQFIKHPPVPLTTTIHGGMTPGKIVLISGITHSACKRFTINLQCGSVSGEDIALHFDVRVQISGEHHRVIRNSHIGGHWGREEVHIPYFPFQSNANVDVMILAEHDKFKIAVNNQHFSEFHYRLRPLNRVNTLHVSGDIRLTHVRFQ